MAKVLVIGASRGIGAALVSGFAARGDEVWATRRSPGTPVHAAVRWVDGVDVGLEAGRAHLAAALATEHAPFDLIVHNAGILHDDQIANLTEEALLQQLHINAVAPLLLIQALLPRLRPGSRVAFLTSRMGSIGDNSSGSHYGYRMSKAALNMAAKTLAVDLAPRGIAIAVLHPGFVRTAMTSGQGQMDPAESAALLIARCDQLDLGNTGSFWHANGQLLPW